jgi:hypothetical protein
MPCLKKFTTCVKLGGVYKIKGKKYGSKSQNIEKKTKQNRLNHPIIKSKKIPIVSWFSGDWR